MRGYAGLEAQHIMFQCTPYTSEALQRLTEAPFSPACAWAGTLPSAVMLERRED